MKSHSSGQSSKVTLMLPNSTVAGGAVDMNDIGMAFNRMHYNSPRIEADHRIGGKSNSATAKRFNDSNTQNHKNQATTTGTTPSSFVAPPASKTSNQVALSPHHSGLVVVAGQPQQQQSQQQQQQQQSQQQKIHFFQGSRSSSKSQQQQQSNSHQQSLSSQSQLIQQQIQQQQQQQQQSQQQFLQPASQIHSSTSNVPHLLMNLNAQQSPKQQSGFMFSQSQSSLAHMKAHSNAENTNNYRGNSASKRSQAHFEDSTEGNGLSSTAVAVVAATASTGGTHNSNYSKNIQRYIKQSTNQASVLMQDLLMASRSGNQSRKGSLSSSSASNIVASASASAAASAAAAAASINQQNSGNSMIGVFNMQQAGIASKKKEQLQQQQQQTAVSSGTPGSTATHAAFLQQKIQHRKNQQTNPSSQGSASKQNFSNVQDMNFDLKQHYRLGQSAHVEAGSIEFLDRGLSPTSSSSSGMPASAVASGTQLQQQVLSSKQQIKQSLQQSQINSSRSQSGIKYGERHGNSAQFNISSVPPAAFFSINGSLSQSGKNTAVLSNFITKIDKEQGGSSMYMNNSSPYFQSNNNASSNNNNNNNGSNTPSTSNSVAAYIAQAAAIASSTVSAKSSRRTTPKPESSGMSARNGAGMDSMNGSAIDASHGILLNNGHSHSRKQLQIQLQQQSHQQQQQQQPFSQRNSIGNLFASSTQFGSSNSSANSTNGNASSNQNHNLLGNSTSNNNNNNNNNMPRSNSSHTSYQNPRKSASQNSPSASMKQQQQQQQQLAAQTPNSAFLHQKHPQSSMNHDKNHFTKSMSFSGIQIENSFVPQLQIPPHAVNSNGFSKHKKAYSAVPQSANSLQSTSTSPPTPSNSSHSLINSQTQPLSLTAKYNLKQQQQQQQQKLLQQQQQQQQQHYMQLQQSQQQDSNPVSISISEGEKRKISKHVSATASTPLSERSPSEQNSLSHQKKSHIQQQFSQGSHAPHSQSISPFEQSTSQSPNQQQQQQQKAQNEPKKILKAELLNNFVTAVKREAPETSMKDSKDDASVIERDSSSSQISSNSNSKKGGNRGKQAGQTTLSKRHPLNLYYLSNLVDAFKTPYSSDPFLQLCRQHFNQTCQGVLFSNSARALNPRDLQTKKVTLGPRDKKYSKTLVFDMDETLIHCNESINIPSDVIVDIKFPSGESLQAGINIRTFAREILAELSEEFEIVIFTASHVCYAQSVIEQLDPGKKHVHHRYFRDHCIQTPQGVYVKDLRIFTDRKLSELVLIDNAAYSFSFQVDNGIPIFPFYDNKADLELKHLMTYLRCLHDVSDVREYNRQHLKMSLFNEPEGSSKVLSNLLSRIS